MLFCPFEIDDDDRRACGCVVTLDEFCIHVVRFEIVEEKISEVIFANTPQHGNGCAQPGSGHCLIGSLAAWGRFADHPR